MNARLGWRINLGNALEAPEEGQWGVTLREAEARGSSGAYWEFCAGFGAYNDETGDWNELHRALVPQASGTNPDVLLRASRDFAQKEPESSLQVGT